MQGPGVCGTVRRQSCEKVLCGEQSQSRSHMGLDLMDHQRACDESEVGSKKIPGTGAMSLYM